MDTETLTTVGSIAFMLYIFSFIWSIVKGFIKFNKPPAPTNDQAHQHIMEDTHDIKEDVHWLREVHDIKTEDGAYLWYVPPSLIKSLERLTVAIKENTKVQNGK